MSDTEEKRAIGKAGGEARALVLSGERKREIAQLGALKRWGAKATHKGNFIDQFEVDVDCYVLDDPNKTAVISQTGMARAIGLTGRGNALPRFLSSQAMVEAVGAELAEKFKNPLKFQWGSGGAEQPPTEVNGYIATDLIDLCRAIVDADAAGKLKPQQKKLATNAAVIIAASAKSGIRDLVYALAGYDQTTDEVIQAFKLYVLEEAKKYEKEFPRGLYEAWHRLYQIPPIQGRGKPWQFLHLTVNHIYWPLANSNGKLLDLLRALRARGGDRKKKLFQFLNDVGARALRTQIGRVWEMADDSSTRAEYEQRITRRFGGQREFDFTPSAEEPAPAK